MENKGVNSDKKDKAVQNITRISELLDTKFTGPFGIKFGLDPILGLIPGVGDIVTTFLTLYIILQAYFLGVGFSIILRMLLNVLIENIVDMIPIFGNFFDIFWKSNLRNLQLLEKFTEDSDRTRQNSRALLLIILVFFVTLSAAITSVSFLILKQVYVFFFAS